MNESLAQALATLDRIDAGPGPGEDEDSELVEAAHSYIAVGLGLTVFAPSNFGYRET